MARSGLFVDPVPGNPPVGTAMADGRRALAAVSGVTFQALSGGIATVSGSNLTVTVQASVWLIPDPADSLGTFWTPTDSTVLTLQAGPATGSRIDLILVKQNNYAGGDADSRASVYLKAGTPSATPVAPAVDAGAQIVATVTVPTSASNSAACTLNYGHPTTHIVPPTRACRTLATLTGSAGEQAGQLGCVYNDTTSANNGLYQWTGAAWDQLETWASWTPFAGTPASPAYPSGFASPGFGYPPAYKLVGGDTIQLSGVFQKSGGAAFATSDTFFSVPSALAPQQTVYGVQNANGSGFVSMQVAAGGAITMHSLKGNSGVTWISLDSMSYRIR